MSQRPIAVVTGASSGIGAELAELLAARGYAIVAIARREARLRELCARISGAGGECRSLSADLARTDERDRIVTELAPNASSVEVLVNNAGFGTHGYFSETDLARELELIEVNCAAVVHLAKGVLPWMLNRRRGFVMNVSSLAAFQAGPLMALYYASKAFVLSFSEALSEECAGTGVVVSALCPATVATEFQSAAGLVPSARPAYASNLSACDVAWIGLDGLFAGRRIVVPGARPRAVLFLKRFFPRQVAVRAVRRIQEARRQDTLARRGGDA
jgi:uncharacterized protein